MNHELRLFLNKKVEQYNTPDFIKDDPICIPHRFSTRQDIEIAGFFAAIFAWGNRTIIINKCLDLLRRMDNAPFDFVKNHHESDLKQLVGFRHRTFNDTDLLYFIQFLHVHYEKHSSMESAFLPDVSALDTMEHSLNHFFDYFFSLPYQPQRTRKHIASPRRKSTCKRLNMFLRWMVRKDDKGVDFGLWNRISPGQLICPIDVHVARVARKFNLIDRKATDWQTATELTNRLKELDPVDPAKYDFALFGLGVIEKF